MSRYHRYPKRTDYHKELQEGGNCLFDVYRRIVVSVAWYAKGDAYIHAGTYRITHAWIAETRANAITFPDYPFVRTKKDKQVVDNIIQSHCEHGWDFWNYHAVCPKCNTWIFGDYRQQVIAEEGEDAVKMHDEWITEKYGPEGLALRKGRAGIEE